MAGTIIVYGFGNPGREDDGLGIEIVKRLEADPVDGVFTESNFQLNIQDALTISAHDTVIFADASMNSQQPYSFYEFDAADEIVFTTHSMSPRSVVALCSELYGRRVRAYMLEIKGLRMDFAEGLTPDASANLELAYAFLRTKLREFLRPADISNL
jgi:hydrogenase maturation protease